MNGLRQFLGAELVLFALGEPLKNLELADAEPMLPAKLVLKCRACGCVTGCDRAPGAYVLGYGGLLLLGGWAADLLGRRRVFLAALALFSVASLFGGLVSSAGLLIAARQAGWVSARTIGSFVAVAALLTLFVWVERRSRDPLVRLDLFTSAALTRANIGAVTLFGSYVAFQFLVTQYLQSLARWSALSMALAFLPAGVIVAVLSTRLDSVIGRFGPAQITIAAFAGLVAGYAWFLRTGVRPDYPAVILPSVLLIGTAFGLGFTALSLSATDGVPDQEQGLAASLFQTSFQVGAAVVLAVVTAVVDAGGANRAISPQATLGAYRPALALITGVSALGAVAALSGLRRAGRQPAPAPIAVAQLEAADFAEAE